MEQKAFQDCYPDELSQCDGCGRLNDHSLKIKSYWDGEETIAVFSPAPYHMAAPGYVYGGLLASIIDCHWHRNSRRSYLPGRGKGNGCPSY